MGAVYDGVPGAARLDGMGSAERWHVAADRYARFADRAELRRLRSVDAARDWADGDIDLVFIDGEHDYDSCKEDILAWIGHVRDGGVVPGTTTVGPCPASGAPCTRPCLRGRRLTWHLAVCG